MEEFGRMDARFICLVADVYPVYRELVDRFTIEQLVELAGRLPFDGEVAAVVMPTRSDRTRDRADFFQWAQAKIAPEMVMQRRRRKSDVAAYCAVVSKDGAAKILAQVEELSRKKLALIENLQQLLHQATPHLRESIKGKRKT